MTVKVRMLIFSVYMPCNIGRIRLYFGGIYFVFVFNTTLMMEAVGSSETLVITSNIT